MKQYVGNVTVIGGCESKMSWEADKNCPLIGMVVTELITRVGLEDIRTYHGKICPC